jgi:hypothetical protein
MATELIMDLTIDQRIQLSKQAEEIRKLSAQDAQVMLIAALHQMMVRDNIIKSLLN